MKIHKILIPAVLMVSNFAMTADKQKEKEKETKEQYLNCDKRCDGIIDVFEGFVNSNVNPPANQMIFAQYQKCQMGCLIDYLRQLIKIDNEK